jgi:prepilin-type N-terminal cleavage/methylation domain-containing protein
MIGTAFRVRGFTLIELVVAMAISTVLVTGMVQMVLAATASFNLQQGLSQVQETARFLSQQLDDTIRPAGFHPQPWQQAAPEVAVSTGSIDALTASGDALELQRWSDRNCFDNPNPDTDGAGHSRYYLRITRFQLSANSLVMRCRYGPDAGNLTTQVNNLALADGVDAFQVQYAEDADGDGLAERWVNANQWSQETALQAVRFATVLASPGPVEGVEAAPFTLLETLYTPPDDRRLRRAFHGAVALAGRLP